MTFSKSLLLGLAVVSLAACSTTKVLPTANDVLLAGIETTDINVKGATTLLSASSPTCLKFYENTATFAALPAADIAVPSLPGVPGVPGIPKKPSFGGQLMKTVILGALSGVVGGSVSSLGISNGFLENTLIGTANQVTYNLGGTVYDNILEGGEPDPSSPEAQAEAAAAEAAKAHDVNSHTHAANGDVIVDASAAASATAAAAPLSPLGEIQSAANQLGCPAPDQAAIAAINMVK